VSGEGGDEDSGRDNGWIRGAGGVEWSYVVGAGEKIEETIADQSVVAEED
jgi:hypothetical protein